jgi:hypothetical protein
MRLFTFILIITLSVVTWGAATPPRQPSLGQFTRLWTNSPFTINPTVEAAVIASPLERDWTLASISPSENGYSVTLMNKKNRKERIRFIPGYSSGDFKLHEVKPDPNSAKNSKVLVSKSGGAKAWIGYDEKLIKVRQSAASKAPTKKTTSATSKRRVPPIPGKSTSKPTPRVRHVPRTK